jgi:hypothetical protein
MTDTTDYKKRCRDIAGFLEWRGYSVAVAAVGVSIFSVSTSIARGIDLTAVMIWLLTVHGISVAATLALSLLLYFDAHLFRRMAAYEDEVTGGRLVDAYLVRKGFKNRPDGVRPLADRIVGARRWAWRQIMMAAVSIASGLLVLALHFA